jgi:hypothetical protein
VNNWKESASLKKTIGHKNGGVGDKKRIIISKNGFIRPVAPNNFYLMRMFYSKRLKKKIY